MQLSRIPCRVGRRSVECPPAPGALRRQAVRSSSQHAQAVQPWHQAVAWQHDRRDRPARGSRQARMAVLAEAADSGIELQVTKEELSSFRRRLNVTVPASAVKQCFHKTVETMRKIVGTLPGYRTDKIPLSIIITNAGGQRKFKMACIEEVLLTALPRAMEQAVKHEGIVPDTEQVVTQVEELESVFDPAKPLSFAVEYDTVPTLKWKRSYKDISVTVQDTGDFTTDAAAVEGLIRGLLKEAGHQSVVADRGLDQGDTAIAELTFCEKGSQLPLPGLSSSRARFDTDEDPLGITPHLLGAQVGDTRRFRITLPDDYRIELWQGMECDVEVTIKELFAWTLPEFTDELVKEKYGEQFESAEDLRKSLLATTAMERVQLLDAALGDAVRDAVVQCIEPLELPPSLLEDMAATQYRAALLDMIDKKAVTHEEVDRLATPELVVEYMDKRRAELTALCVFNVAADEIWAAEGMSLDAKDVDEEVRIRKQQYDAQQVEYDEEAIRDQVVDTLKHLRVVEWLKDNVKRDVLPYQAAAAPSAATSAA